MVKNIIRNLPGLIREGKNLNDWADAWNLEFNEIDNTVIAVKNAIQLSTATDLYLDDIGKLFSLSRNVGETDEEFRSRIKAFWPGFSGSGTEEDLKNVINRITGIAVNDIIITDIVDMKILIEFNIGPNFNLIDTVKDLIFQNKAAGIYPFFEIKSGFEDEVSWNDNLSITVLILKTWDNFKWGDNSLWL